ncbi:hypothetical protein IMZ11_32030 [Microtetraspora sp. AC03309]|uniref:hypothetical protein n=1 Tax=Microtetraspora sp. AC03309 TaxID=2779376 RepID=UPI001E6322B3|nr:hypothetical protein [Microtetraspora sp. AC03309]MCC5580260.1 hypothetical protein [Microtetraspora sp. AC03309]
MKRSTIAVLVVVCMGLGAVLVAPIALWVLTYGCTADDDRLAASLATLSILDARPVNATPLEGRSSSCENDDRITTVWQTYRLSGPRADVWSFYRDIAIKDGWMPPPEDDGEGVVCFTKSIDGRDVELSVRFVDATGEKHGDDYDVDVSSSVDGGGWC